jgi:hypothetical protein
MASRELKKLNQPMEQEEINQYLSKHTTLNAYLNSYGYYIVDPKEDPRGMTHTGLNGRRYHVPHRQYPAFLALLIRDLNRLNPETYYICEFLTDRFRMFCDLDIEHKGEITEKDWMDLAAVTQASMKKYYKQNIQAAWFLTKVEKKRNENNEVINRYGLHIVWSNLIVDRDLALKVYNLLLADIKRVLPPTEPPSNSWEDRLDKRVYGVNKPGSLRMPGCEKMKPCKSCSKKKKKDEGSPECKYCDNSGKISIGRPYHPVWIFNDDGKVDLEQTRLFQTWEVAIMLGHLRMPYGIPLTEGFEAPKNAARIYNPMLAYSDADSIPASLLDKEGNPIKEKKRVLSKNLAHLEEFLTFPDNKKGWKKVSTRFKYRVDNDNIRTMVQSAIRQYNENYADINLLDLRTDKKTRPSTWLVLVDGTGSNFCLNKGDNHNSSSVYFMITPDGNLYQKCNSTRPVDREVGLMYCSNYESTYRGLPDLTKECLTWKKNESFGSLDEQLSFKKYESVQKSKSVDGPASDAPMAPMAPMGENAKTLAAIIKKNNVNRDPHDRRKSFDETYMYNLYLLNFQCRNSIKDFDRADLKIDESDIRNMRLTEIPSRKNNDRERQTFAEQLSIKITPAAGTGRGAGGGGRGKRKL